MTNDDLLAKIMNAKPKKEINLKEKLNTLSESNPLIARMIQEAEAQKPQTIMIEHLNYANLLNLDNVDEKFVQIFEQILAGSAERGNVFKLGINGFEGMDQEPIKFSLFRFKPENIDYLVSHVNEVFNPSKQATYLKPVNIIFPDISVFNINKNAEACTKDCLHIAFDIETNQHQQLYAEKYMDEEITGGVKGVYFAEAQRYLQFFHVRKKKDSKIEIYHTKKGQTWINFYGTNPIEALLHCSAELWIAMTLLSSLMDGQKELISIFDEITSNIPFKLNAEILRRFLFHEVIALFKCHNANFDVNQIINTYQKNKQKGFHSILPKTSPKTLTIHHGKVEEKLESQARTFEFPFGNIQAGFRYKILHDTHFLTKGKPEFLVAPVQTDSTYTSYAIDTNLLGRACQFRPPIKLENISANTQYPKLPDISPLFSQKDFFFNEGPKYFNLSQASHYLYRDCLAVLAGYGRESHMLDLTKIGKATNISMNHLFLDSKPLVYKIYSTATLAKEFTIAELLHHTQLPQEVIFSNLRKSQQHFYHWNEVTTTYWNGTQHIVHIHPIFLAGRVETFGYGYFRTNPTKNWIIADTDFKSQYPHCARQICASQQLYLAAQYQLHHKTSKNLEELERRLWFGIEKILRGIHTEGKIPDKTFIYFNFIATVHFKKPFHIRSSEKEITFPKKEYWKRPKAPKKCDKLVKGVKKLYGTELMHSIIRLYELSPYYYHEEWSAHKRLTRITQWNNLTHEEKINRIKSFFTIKDGEFFDFSSEDVKDHGDETYTQLVKLRDTIKSKPYEKGDDTDLTQEQLKIIANGKIGLNNEGHSKNYSGKYQCPSIPVGITGVAKACSNIAEIYCRKWGGIPLYTHTDSLKLIAPRQTVDRIKKLFIDIDPLAEEAEKDEEYQDIDFIFVFGKSKYAIHSAKTNTWHLTDAGSGSYSGYLVAPIYQKFAQLLYEKHTFEQAVHICKKDFPLAYNLSLKKTRKALPSTIQPIKRLFKTEPIEILQFNDKCTIYCFEEKRTKESIHQRKTKQGLKEITTKRTEWRKIFSTSPHFHYGNFCNYSTFSIPKIDKKLVEEKKQCIQELRKRAKTNPNLRGWSNLKTAKEMKQALKNGFVPQIIRTSDFIITEKAKELAQEFPKLNALTTQHLLNFIDKVITDNQTFDLQELDHSLTYHELKEAILNYAGKTEDSIDFEEMTEEEMFNYIKDQIIIQYEQEHLTEEEYNLQLDALYKEYNKDQISKTKREYIYPFPIGANKISFSLFAAIDFMDFIHFIIENSKVLTPHERKILEKQINERPKGAKHLKNRFSFHTKFYQRKIPFAMENQIKDIIKERILKTSKKKDLTQWLKTTRHSQIPQKLPDKIKNKIQKTFEKPSTITNLVWGKEAQFNFIELIPHHENNDEKGHSPFPDPSNRTIYPSDGLGFKGIIHFPDINFSEYLIGDSNKAVSQALVNTARTLSCEYVKTHIDDKNKQAELIQKYIYDTNIKDLPCPKLGGKIDYHDRYSGTVRFKFAMLPKFDNFTDMDVIQATNFTITFYDYIQTWLKEKIIEKIPNLPNFFLINDATLINEINKEIHKRKWLELNFLNDTWTFEILPWNKSPCEKANGSFFIGVVAGKNRKLKYSMYFNPSTNRLINFNLFPTIKQQLIENSDIAKDIMKKVIKTNTLTSFSRNASLTLEDLQEKKKPTFLLERVYLCMAQLALESAINNSTTQLHKYHITHDLQAKTQDIADFSIFLLNRAMQKAYAEITSSIPDLFEEVKFRHRLSIGQSKQGNASALQNFARARSHISYFKNEQQLVNKLKRVFMDSELPENVFTDFRERVKLKENIIRVESQLNSFKAINDPTSYEMHQKWKEIVELAIKLVTLELLKTDNIFYQFDLLANRLSPYCKKFIENNAKDLYAEVPYATISKKPG